MKQFVSISIVVFLISLFLIGCKESVNSSDHPETEVILKNLDSLHVEYLQVHCGYNGFPTYPPTERYATVSGTVRLHNISLTGIVDTVSLDRCRLFRHTGDEFLFDLKFDDIYWYGDTLSSGRLDPGEIDTVWFLCNFDPSNAPCGDSVYFELTIRNDHGDSTSLRSPMSVFECSQ